MDPTRLGAPWLLRAGIVTAALVFLAPTAMATPVIAFDMVLTSMTATARNVSLPLVSDPSNALGDSVGGFGFLDTDVTILVETSTFPPRPPSVGRTTASAAVAGATAGNAYQLDSFFDVVFAISFSDVDRRTGRDFFGQADGGTIASLVTGPLRISTSYTAPLDPGAPGLGLLPPPEAAPYVGFGPLEVFGGMDINGNGETDTVKLTLFSLAVGDQNRTFITLPDGTVLWTFDARLQVAGTVADASVDPPFGPFNLTGPTTATSRLLDGEPTGVPEPTTAALIALGIVAASVARSSRRRKGSAG